MDDVAARAWANSQLGEGVTWLNGRIDPTETWYWVANPALHHAQRPNTDPHPDQDRLLRPFGRSTGRRTPPPHPPGSTPRLPRPSRRPAARRAHEHFAPMRLGEQRDDARPAVTEACLPGEGLAWFELVGPSLAGSLPARG